MTSRFRLFAALAAFAAALLIGWSAGARSAQESPVSAARGGIALARLDVADIDRFVEAVAGSDLFPAARLRGEGLGARSRETNPDSAAALAEALADPNLSALVARGEVWRIHLYGPVDGPLVREVGDQLADGWIIAAIEPTAVILERDGQSRRIDVFLPELSSDET